MLARNTAIGIRRARRRAGLAIHKSASPSTQAQGGFTLIELMVGITIGLLTIAVAMGALMVSRSVSGTVSDTSGVQQQAAYAMRVIGMQLRQAGSIRLNMNPNSFVAQDLYIAPVGFEATAPASGSAKGFNPSTDTISGTNSLPRSHWAIAASRSPSSAVQPNRRWRAIASEALIVPTRTSGWRASSSSAAANCNAVATARQPSPSSRT